MRWSSNILTKPQMKRPQQLSSDVLTVHSAQGSRSSVASQCLLQAVSCSPSLRPAQCKASVEKCGFLAQILACLCCVPALPQTLPWSYMTLEFYIRGQVLQIDISILLGSPWLSQYRIFTVQTVSRSLSSLYSVETQILMIGNLLLLPCELNEPVSVFSMSQIPLLYFFQCLEILTFNLILNSLRGLGELSFSILHLIYMLSCLFKGNYYKMGHAQALQITEEAALWEDSSLNIVYLMISSHCHLQSICVPSITIVTERSFRQKWETDSAELQLDWWAHQSRYRIRRKQGSCPWFIARLNW